MPFIPSSRNKVSEALQNATSDALRGSLSPYFKGRGAEARLEKAVADAVESIKFLLGENKKAPLGATIMTEDASAKKTPGNTPRTI